MKKFLKNLVAVVLVMCVVVLAMPMQADAAKKKSNAGYAKVFDASYYASTYADVAAAYGNDANKLLAHYIAFGINEGRNASANFNAKAYRELNADLNAAFGDDWAAYHEHYATLGINEGRKAIGKGKAQAKPAAKPAAPAANGNVIGIYSTKYNAKIPRANNVALAASRINGVVVRPGQGFSFSNTILPRTTENGYVVAPVYVNKKVSSGVGGGICQVSSTLYAAMLSAGLPATERHPHSLPVSYLPAGMDATISGNTLDLKFTNIYDKPLVINASADNGTLTVSLTLQ